MKRGDVFIAWQVTDRGQPFKGSRLWYGNHYGTEWVHSSRITYEGGST
jgi:hypothetical protein